MIISHSNQFIFVHVPKAAGTSLTSLLSKHTTYRDLELGGTPLGEAIQPAFKARFGLHKHSKAAEVRAVVGDETWHRYYTFGFVRNPYARAQSTFHYIKRWRAEKHHAQLAFIDKFADFRSFVASDLFLARKAHMLMATQASWLCDADGAVLVNFVGRVESLDADIDRIVDAIPGVKAARSEAKPAPALNKSESTDAALQALLSTDAQAEQRIYDTYRDDFDRFGYERFSLAPAPAG